MQTHTHPHTHLQKHLALGNADVACPEASLPQQLQQVLFLFFSRGKIIEHFPILVVHIFCPHKARMRLVLSSSPVAC